MKKEPLVGKNVLNNLLYCTVWGRISGQVTSTSDGDAVGTPAAIYSVISPHISLHMYALYRCYCICPLTSHSTPRNETMTKLSQRENLISQYSQTFPLNANTRWFDPKDPVSTAQHNHPSEMFCLRHPDETKQDQVLKLSRRQALNALISSKR